MRHLVAPVLAVPLLVLLPASATAAPATCQGRPATISADGGPVSGTEGDDVISTTGVVDIRALGGNDVICLSAGQADAGAGDDTVELNVAKPADAAVLGSDGSDSLRLVGPQAAPQPGEPTAMHYFVLLYAGQVVTGGQVSFAGFEKYSLDFHRSVGVSVDGTTGPDDVELVEGDYAVALHEGDDRVEISGYDLSGIVAGEAGKDALWSLDSARIDLRLGNRGGVVMGGTAFDLRGFEDAVVEAARVTVRGSNADNTLDLTGCIVQGSGRGGDDALNLGAVEDLSCTQRNLKLDGGGGRDRLTGSSLPDLLVGGSGRDQAYGRGGRDRCAAEVEVRCEANPRAAA